MTPAQRKKLDEASRINKPVWFKDKQTGQRILWGTVAAEVFIIVGEEHDDPYKHIIQKIRPTRETWDGSEWFYRTGYYTFGGRNKERLVWGQYTQCLTEREYTSLLSRAKEKGWAIF
jgi:hypothetical protein